MGFSEDRDCACNEGRETVSHVLLDCRLESVHREELKNNIQEIWMESRCIGNLNFELSLMLFPFSNSNVNEDCAVKILEKSFNFLKKLSKKL